MRHMRRALTIAFAAALLRCGGDSDGSASSAEACSFGDNTVSIAMPFPPTELAFNGTATVTSTNPVRFVVDGVADDDASGIDIGDAIDVTITGTDASLALGSHVELQLEARCTVACTINIAGYDAGTSTLRVLAWTDPTFAAAADGWLLEYTAQDCAAASTQCGSARAQRLRVQHHGVDVSMVNAGEDATVSDASSARVINGQSLIYTGDISCEGTTNVLYSGAMLVQ